MTEKTLQSIFLPRAQGIGHLMRDRVWRMTGFGVGRAAHGRADGRAGPDHQVPARVRWGRLHRDRLHHARRLGRRTLGRGAGSAE